MEHAEKLEQLMDEENCKNDTDEEKARNETIHSRDDGEINEFQSEWAFLPDVCLRHVFWWLCDRDRAHAALVCRNWHQAVHSPSLWRQRSFSFSGRISQGRRPERNTAVNYLRAYGRYLEDLEVRLRHPINSLVCRRFQQTLQAVLASLRKAGARLRALSILHMDLDRSAWCHSVRNALVTSLTFYLRRDGSTLNYVSLRGARFSLRQGLEVLEAVAAAQKRVHLGCRSGLLSLNMEDFFTQSLAVYSSPEFPKVMHRYKGLSSLTINYSCISDDLLRALASSCVGLNGAGTLCSFTVCCYMQEPHGQLIWGDAWALLALRCPALKVQMYLERILAEESLSHILLREIPLRSLSLAGCYFSDFPWTIKPALLNLVPQYRNCLEKLTLDINNIHETVDEELLQVVTVCSKLTYLKVWAFLSISFLERLLQKCLDKKCALDTIKVRLYINKYETHEEDTMLQELFSRYRQLIDSELNYLAVSYPMF